MILSYVLYMIWVLEYLVFVRISISVVCEIWLDRLYCIDWHSSIPIWLDQRYFSPIASPWRKNEALD